MLTCFQGEDHSRDAGKGGASKPAESSYVSQSEYLRCAYVLRNAPHLTKPNHASQSIYSRHVHVRGLAVMDAWVGICVNIKVEKLKCVFAGT